VTIGSLVAQSEEARTTRVKKSGFSIGGGAVFIGSAKVRNSSTLETSTNAGSLVGSEAGDVSIAAGVAGLGTGEGGAVSVSGSRVAAPGAVSLSGDSVSIESVTDTANGTQSSRSSSAGSSIGVYENVSGAVRSVGSLVDRIGDGSAGGAA